MPLHGYNIGGPRSPVQKTQSRRSLQFLLLISFSPVNIVGKDSGQVQVCRNVFFYKLHIEFSQIIIVYNIFELTQILVCSNEAQHSHDNHPCLARLNLGSTEILEIGSFVIFLIPVMKWEVTEERVEFENNS